MAGTLILSSYPSDSSPNIGLKYMLIPTIDKNYQLSKQNLDPLRFKGVECIQSKGSKSLAFSLFLKWH